MHNSSFQSHNRSMKYHAKAIYFG